MKKITISALLILAVAGSAFAGSCCNKKKAETCPSDGTTTKTK